LIEDMSEKERPCAGPHRLLRPLFHCRSKLPAPQRHALESREPGEDFEYLPELDVQRPSPGDARALLIAAVRFKVDALIRELL
jgi:hypothetical protein